MSVKKYEQINVPQRSNFLLLPILFGIQLCVGTPGAVMAQGVAAKGAPSAMLRVACEGSDTNAEITLNGQFKGECPVDIPLTGGAYILRAMKKFGVAGESFFEQEFRIVDGTVKRVNVVLGPMQLTPEGRRQEDARIAREKAEAPARALAARRKAEIEANARTNAIADQILEMGRLGRVPVPHCVNCPVITRGGSGLDLSIPKSDDAEMNEWLAQWKQEAAHYIATSGTEFIPPLQSPAMPCIGADEKLRSLAKLVSLSEQTPEQQRIYRERESRRALNPLMYVRDVKLWLVEGACKNGILDGPLEFWAFGIQVERFDRYWTKITPVDSPWHLREETVVQPKLVRVRTTMANGEPTGVVHSIARTRLLESPGSIGSMKPPDERGFELVVSNYVYPEASGIKKGLNVIFTRNQSPSMAGDQSKPYFGGL